MPFLKLDPLVSKIQGEIEKRIDPNEQKSPFWYNGKLFQARNEEGMEYEKIYALKNDKATLFFDENERAKNQSFYDRRIDFRTGAQLSHFAHAQKRLWHRPDYSAQCGGSADGGGAAYGDFVGAFFL